MGLSLEHHPGVVSWMTSSVSASQAYFVCHADWAWILVQMRGGGVIHGPVPRSHEHSLNRKVRRMGMKCALAVSSVWEVASCTQLLPLFAPNRHSVQYRQKPQREGCTSSTAYLLAMPRRYGNSCLLAPTYQSMNVSSNEILTSCMVCVESAR